MTENLTKEFFVSEKKPLFHAEGAKKGSDTNYVKTKKVRFTARTAHGVHVLQSVCGSARTDAFVCRRLREAAYRIRKEPRERSAAGSLLPLSAWRA